jgi:hypothetical protein
VSGPAIGGRVVGRDIVGVCVCGVKVWLREVLRR